MKTILSLLSLILFSNITIAQTTAIPDSNFEQELINLGYDSGSIDGVVTTSNISAVTFLNIGTKNIADLSGIEDFTALTTLYCHYNQLTSLDVTQNLALEVLNFSGNSISTINVTQNTNLTWLSAGFNQLNFLDITQNIALENLACGYNQLTSIDVTQNVNLIQFSCHTNQLTSLDVTQNTSMQNLTFTANQIPSIDVTQMPALSGLRCDSNQISNLDISQNQSLLLLICRGNLLTNLDISQNLSLETLYCEANQLTNLNISGNLDLETLTCGYNQLVGLDASQNTALSFFHCENNLLSCLNFNNGMTPSILVNVNFTNNANLTCIEVGDAAAATSGWTSPWDIDPGVFFSTNCNNSCSTPCNNTGTDTRTECNSLTWIDGNTYTANNNTATFNMLGGNANGCDSLVTLDLTISNLDANYTYADNGSGNYSFTNTSTGSFNQSHWAFGDGTIDSIANPNHTFTTNGIFTVILTILDSTVQGDSCISYYINTINVTGVTNPLQCNAGFVIYPDTTGNVSIVNNATGINLTYLWDFGDGNTSSLQNPSHTYATAGPFYLCLTIDDGNGCTDIYCDSIGKNGVIFNKAGGFNINITTPITTGIDNNIDLSSEINIYPNPTSNQLTIDIEQNISEIIIIDITGKNIKTITPDLNVINVADLSDGIYFIKLITNERTITKKFVKQ